MFLKGQLNWVANSPGSLHSEGKGRLWSKIYDPFFPPIFCSYAPRALVPVHIALFSTIYIFFRRAVNPEKSAWPAELKLQKIEKKDDKEKKPYDDWDEEDDYYDDDDWDDDDDDDEDYEDEEEDWLDDDDDDDEYDDEYYDDDEVIYLYFTNTRWRD